MPDDLCAKAKLGHFIPPWKIVSTADSRLSMTSCTRLHVHVQQTAAIGKGLMLIGHLQVVQGTRSKAGGCIHVQPCRAVHALGCAAPVSGLLA